MLKFSMVYEFTVQMSENIKGETKLNQSTFKSILYLYTWNCFFTHFRYKIWLCPIVINAASVIIWDVPNVDFITQACYEQKYCGIFFLSNWDLRPSKEGSKELQHGFSFPFCLLFRAKPQSYNPPIMACMFFFSPITFNNWPGHFSWTNFWLWPIVLNAASVILWDVPNVFLLLRPTINKIINAIFIKLGP